MERGPKSKSKALKAESDLNECGAMWREGDNKLWSEACSVSAAKHTLMPL